MDSPFFPLKVITLMWLGNHLFVCMDVVVGELFSFLVIASSLVIVLS